jgi:hypothetical protein
VGTLELEAARRRWPNAAWIIGSGPWACAAYGDDTTVMLFATEAEAARVTALIGRLARGQTTLREHELVHLHGDLEPTAADRAP